MQKEVVVWLPQLTSLGTYVEHRNYMSTINDPLHKDIYHCHLRHKTSFLMDILHTSWEVVVIKIATLQLR